MDDWQKYLPKAPQTQDDMDERSAKNRLFIAKNIAEYGGVSIKDQCDFFNKISSTRAQISASIREQKEHVHANIGLANRYRITLGATFLSFCLFKRHAMRRTFMVFGGLTWFMCPELGSAYLYPKKSLADMVSEGGEQSKSPKSSSSPKKVEIVEAAKPVVEAAQPVVNTSQASRKVEELRAEAAKLIEE